MGCPGAFSQLCETLWLLGYSHYKRRVYALACRAANATWISGRSPMKQFDRSRL
jgi:hypothetical protein